MGSYIKSDEYKSINPNNKVPSITDGTFSLFESHAILRYLHTTRNVADHWYPSNPEMNAKVNEYLDWHHAGTRVGAAGYFFNNYMFTLRGKPLPQQAIKEARFALEKALGLIENYWLKDPNQKFLVGNEITIADLSFVCEIMQLETVGFEIKEKWPKTSKYIEGIMGIKEFEEVHKFPISKMK